MEQGIVDVRCESTCRELDEMLESIKTLVASGACDRPVDDIRHRYISPVSPPSPIESVRSDGNFSIDFFLSFFPLSSMSSVRQLLGGIKGADSAEIVLDAEYHQVSNCSSFSAALVFLAFERRRRIVRATPSLEI